MPLVKGSVIGFNSQWVSGVEVVQYAAMLAIAGYAFIPLVVDGEVIGVRVTGYNANAN